MFRNNKKEITLIAAFIVILILLLNPFGFWMPDALTYMMVAGILVVFTLFAGFILKESSRDERELLHKMFAGRIGYVAGLAVLVLAVAYEGLLSAHVNPWIIAALAAMVLARFFATLYISHRG